MVESSVILLVILRLGADEYEEMGMEEEELETQEEEEGDERRRKEDGEGEKSAISVKRCNVLNNCSGMIV